MRESKRTHFTSDEANKRESKKSHFISKSTIQFYSFSQLAKHFHVAHVGFPRSYILTLAGRYIFNCRLKSL